MHKKRFMSREDWLCIQKKKQCILPFEKDGKKGKISLLKMIEVDEPFSIRDNDNQLIICDRDYSWLQLAMDKDCLWFTAMFNEKDELFQIYMDLSDGNQTRNKDPFFIDMYIDYVMDRYGYKSLDQNELEMAYQNKSITDKQYKKAKENDAVIQKELANQLNNLWHFFEEEYKRLRIRI